MQKGLVREESAADFVTAMEQQKQNYNDAKTVAEKKAVIKGVQRLWKEFISNAKGKGQGQTKNESNSNTNTTHDSGNIIRKRLFQQRGGKGR